jgi:hypothetical protein
VSLRWSLASQQIMGGGYIHRAFYRLSRPVCRFVGGCSCRASACFAGSPELPQQPVHHWHFSIKQSKCRLEFCLISISCAFAKSQTVLILVNKLHVTSKNSRLPVQMPPLIADSERSSECSAQRPRCV